LDRNIQGAPAVREKKAEHARRRGGGEKKSKPVMRRSGEGLRGSSSGETPVIEFADSRTKTSR